MATNETLIPIPGRLHSIANEHHVAGADEIFDDNWGANGSTQSTINQTLGNKQNPLSFSQVYDEVEDTTNKNPSEEGWYELNGTTYSLTSDSTVVDGKTYYILRDYYELIWQ